MKGIVYFVGLSIGMLIVLFFLMVGFITFQEEYVCKPKVAEAISQFLDSVLGSEYESLKKTVNFSDEQDFLMFKDLISKKYSWEIREWQRATVAVTIFKFETGPPYAVTLVLNGTNLPICWGQRYKVLTVAR